MVYKSVIILCWLSCAVLSAPGRVLKNPRKLDVLNIFDGEQRQVEKEMRKHIKSIFQLPPSLGAGCDPGYEIDISGKCIEVLIWDEENYFQFLLNKLNDKFAYGVDRERRSYKNGDADGKKRSEMEKRQTETTEDIRNTGITEEIKSTTTIAEIKVLPPPQKKSKSLLPPKKSDALLLPKNTKTLQSAKKSRALPPSQK